jgi:hypothetical protein
MAALKGWEEGIRITRSHSKLGKRDRYRTPVLGKKFPDVIDLMEQPEMGFLEQKKAEASTEEKRQQSLIFPTKRIWTRINELDLSVNDFGLGELPEVVNRQVKFVDACPDPFGGKDQGLMSFFFCGGFCFLLFKKPHLRLFHQIYDVRKLFTQYRCSVSISFSQFAVGSCDTDPLFPPLESRHNQIRDNTVNSLLEYGLVYGFSFSFPEFITCFKALYLDKDIFTALAPSPREGLKVLVKGFGNRLSLHQAPLCCLQLYIGTGPSKRKRGGRCQSSI